MQVRSAHDIGLFIRGRPKHNKLDQAGLAAMIGVNRRWVIEVEAGKPRAEVGLILKALAALGVGLSIDSPDPPAAAPLDPVDIDAIVRAAREPAA